MTYGEDDYAESGFGFGISQAPEATPADIRVTAMTATISDPCIEGTCSASISITWTNNGESSGMITPNISIDGNPVTPEPYQSQSLGAYPATVTKIFIITGLTVEGSPHTICPIPN